MILGPADEGVRRDRSQKTAVLDIEPPNTGIG